MAKLRGEAREERGAGAEAGYEEQILELLETPGKTPLGGAFEETIVFGPKTNAATLGFSSDDAASLAIGIPIAAAATYGGYKLVQAATSGPSTSKPWLYKLSPAYWVKSKREKKYIDIEKGSSAQNEQDKLDLAAAQRAYDATESVRQKESEISDIDKKLRGGSFTPDTSATQPAQGGLTVPSSTISGPPIPGMNYKLDKKILNTISKNGISSKVGGTITSDEFAAVTQIASQAIGDPARGQDWANGFLMKQNISVSNPDGSSWSFENGRRVITPAAPADVSMTTSAGDYGPYNRGSYNREGGGSNGGYRHHHHRRGQAPYGTNQYGQSVNQYGQPVNQYGQSVNQYGQPVNQYGQSVNQYGQPVNQYGQPITPYPGQVSSPTPGNAPTFNPACYAGTAYAAEAYGSGNPSYVQPTYTPPVPGGTICVNLNGDPDEGLPPITPQAARTQMMTPTSRKRMPPSRKKRTSSGLFVGYAGGISPWEKTLMDPTVMSTIMSTSAPTTGVRKPGQRGRYASRTAGMFVGYGGVSPWEKTLADPTLMSTVDTSIDPTTGGRRRTHAFMGGKHKKNRHASGMFVGYSSASPWEKGLADTTVFSTVMSTIDPTTGARKKGRHGTHAAGMFVGYGGVSPWEKTLADPTLMSTVDTTIDPTTGAPRRKHAFMGGKHKKNRHHTSGMFVGYGGSSPWEKTLEDPTIDSTVDTTIDPTTGGRHRTHAFMGAAATPQQKAQQAQLLMEKITDGHGDELDNIVSQKGLDGKQQWSKGDVDAMALDFLQTVTNLHGGAAPSAGDANLARNAVRYYGIKNGHSVMGADPGSSCTQRDQLINQILKDYDLKIVESIGKHDLFMKPNWTNNDINDITSDLVAAISKRNNKKLSPGDAAVARDAVKAYAIRDNRAIVSGNGAIMGISLTGILKDVGYVAVSPVLGAAWLGKKVYNKTRYGRWAGKQGPSACCQRRQQLAAQFQQQQTAQQQITVAEQQQADAIAHQQQLRDLEQAKANTAELQARASAAQDVAAESTAVQCNAYADMSAIQGAFVVDRHTGKPRPHGGSWAIVGMLHPAMVGKAALAAASRTPVGRKLRIGAEVARMARIHPPTKAKVAAIVGAAKAGNPRAKKQLKTIRAGHVAGVQRNAAVQSNAVVQRQRAKRSAAAMNGDMSALCYPNRRHHRHHHRRRGGGGQWGPNQNQNWCNQNQNWNNRGSNWNQNQGEGGYPPGRGPSVPGQGGGYVNWIKRCYGGANNPTYTPSSSTCYTNVSPSCTLGPINISGDSKGPNMANKKQGLGASADVAVALKAASATFGLPPEVGASVLQAANAGDPTAQKELVEATKVYKAAQKGDPVALKQMNDVMRDMKAGYAPAAQKAAVMSAAVATDKGTKNYKMRQAHAAKAARGKTGTRPVLASRGSMMTPAYAPPATSYPKSFWEILKPISFGTPL
jgi:hypothetical protein